MNKDVLKKFNLATEVMQILEKVKVIIPESRNQLLDLTLNGQDVNEVAYDIPGKGRIVEATVTSCKNGASVNYTDPNLRRRDPEAMVIGDDLPTDKVTFKQRFNKPFAPIRQETLDWLGSQEELFVMPFLSGNDLKGYPSLLIAPRNAAFFVAGLADLQGFIPLKKIPDNFTPQGIIYVAPSFRHTHFDGKQVVVHHRSPDLHEIYSYNLYPGPSAKKGVYSILIDRGETDGWVTLHSSAVRVVTPYDNEFVILHEGASGGGKSEMTQPIHRESDGRVLFAKSVVNNEEHFLEMHDTCALYPVTDDMSLSHPNQTSQQKKLRVADAENGWFLRVDHLYEYGKEPSLEKLTINPPEPLIFLNIDAKPGATALIWEHIMDAPGKPCSNPRVIMPRHFIENIVTCEVDVDVRSFGVRCPPCTEEKPSYGIIGMLHILPPALGWLWRLAAPRGHANPSVNTGAGNSLVSEGVGTYWPFSTGKRVTQANMLLDLQLQTPGTKYVLIPNQHVGAYKVGFNAEWISREVMARRGNLRFRDGVLQPSRCPLLGYSLPSMKVNGQQIPRGMLQVNEQIEVGNAAYDKGAKALQDFFKAELSKYLTDDLHPLGRKIIQVCLDNGTLADYIDVLPG
jgi:hypothetical protein